MGGLEWEGGKLMPYRVLELWRHPFLRWGALGEETGCREDGNYVRGPVNY